MKAPFQGTLCLVVGIVGLLGYVILDLESPRLAGGIQDTPAAGDILTPLADDSWQTTYWGESLRREDGMEEHVAWTVTIYELPTRDRLQRRSVLIHAAGQPILGTKWIRGDAEPRERLAAIKRDAGGELREWLTEPGVDFDFFPLDMLLIQSPSALVAHPKAYGLNKSSPLEVSPVSSTTGELQPGLTHYSVGDQTPGVQLFDGQRRLRLSFDSNQQRIASMDMIARWKRRTKPVTCEFNLRWGNTSNIAADRVLALEQDLIIWEQANQRMLKLVDLDCGTSNIDEQTMLSNYQIHESALSGDIDAVTDPMIKAAMMDWQAEPEINTRRVEDSIELLDELRTIRDDRWRAIDLEGRPVNTEQINGRVQVLGFVFRGLNDPVQVINLLQQIRRQFNETDVFVAGLATDVELDDRLAVRAVFPDNIPVFEGEPVLKSKDLYRCGLPAILIIDRSGTPRLLQTCFVAGSQDNWIDAIQNLVNEQLPSL